MLSNETKKIIDNSRSRRWVLEPDAKAVMAMADLDIPVNIVTDSLDAAAGFLKDIGSPVVVKAVSAEILHKTEHQAVVTGVSDKKQLENEMTRLLKLPGCSSILVEEMVKGVEVIVGAKNDHQFGPVIVFGTGGTAVEIYNDTAIRMAPLKPGDVHSMADSLTAKQILMGYRGADGINMEMLTRLMVDFSHLVIDLEPWFESIDLNPVICTTERCVIADARIILTDDPE